MTETTVDQDVPTADVILDGPEGDQTRITQDGQTRIYEDDIVELVN